MQWSEAHLHNLVLAVAAEAHVKPLCGQAVADEPGLKLGPVCHVVGLGRLEPAGEVRHVVAGRGHSLPVYEGRGVRQGPQPVCT